MIKTCLVKQRQMIATCSLYFVKKLKLKLSLALLSNVGPNMLWIRAPVQRRTTSHLNDELWTCNTYRLPAGTPFLCVFIHPAVVLWSCWRLSYARIMLVSCIYLFMAVIWGKSLCRSQSLGICNKHLIDKHKTFQKHILWPSWGKQNMCIYSRISH